MPDAPSHQPNPFNRLVGIFTTISLACVVAAAVGIEIGGTAAIALGATGGTVGFLLGFGAIVAHRHAMRFDEEQDRINRGEILADWTLAPDDWNHFVENVQSLLPAPSSCRRYQRTEVPVRVTVLPRSIRWQGQYALWGTATMQLVTVDFDESRHWIEVNVIAVGPDMRVRQVWFVPVPAPERSRVPEIVAGLHAGV